MYKTELIDELVSSKIYNFTSIVNSEIFIETEVCNAGKFCRLSSVYLQFDNNTNMKISLGLLNWLIAELKTKNIKKVINYFSKDDWDEYISENTSWKLVDYDEYTHTCEVECDIDDVLDNIGSSLNIKNLHEFI